MKPEKPQNPGAPKPAAGKSYDSLLDPLPLPDVVESDSDTAWGLWQDSVQSGGDGTPSIPAKDTGYDETAPMDLPDASKSPKADI